MTAINHAVTGALIGLTITNPVIAWPLAFLSHFVLDALPHYDQPEQNVAKRIRSKRFIYEQLVIGAALCLILVVVLAITHPAHWVSGAICAFLATSPDLFWIPRFLYVTHSGRDRPLTNPFLRFHAGVQWLTGPKLIWVEAVWFVSVTTVLATKL